MPGFYRGFTTVVLGIIPARVLYMTTLEGTKGLVRAALGPGSGSGLSEDRVVAVGNFLGGGCASMLTQTVVAPVDVVSQRQMIAKERVRPVEQFRQILRQEGLPGFYRGYWASVALYVPSSALWWGAYGVYQPLVWDLRRRLGGRGAGDKPGEGQVVAVQAASGLLAGMTSGALTTPLDVVKTRLQTSPLRADGGRPPGIGQVVRELYGREGPLGFLRGLGPRMANVSLWGTCMVVVYEGLKRSAATATASGPGG